MAETPAKTTKPRKSTTKVDTATTADGSGAQAKRSEAKSRFNAALDEARAGAAALGAEARERAEGYKSQALTKGDDWTGEAKARAAELAEEGKHKASEALTSLSQVVADNCDTIDENLGPKYGDYARTASQKLRETAEQIDQKSIEELGEDARQFVRKSPGTAVGLAAFAGFMLARIFRR